MGKTEITPLQEEFIEWLVDPEHTGSQVQWAADHGVAASTLTNWKRRDIIFRHAWEARLADLNVNPDRVQKIMDAAYERAVAGDMKAAELYMKLVDRITPPKLEVEVKRPSQMTDAELAAAAREHLKVIDGGVG